MLLKMRNEGGNTDGDEKKKKSDASGEKSGSHSGKENDKPPGLIR